jgi:hypothetical protein
MWVSLAGGTDLDDDLPSDRAFSLGGPKTPAACQFDELRARGYWLADMSFLWRLVDLVPVKNQAIYGGFGLQDAGLYGRVDRCAFWLSLGRPVGSGSILDQGIFR